MLGMSSSRQAIAASGPHAATCASLGPGGRSSTHKSVTTTTVSEKGKRASISNQKTKKKKEGESEIRGHHTTTQRDLRTIRAYILCTHVSK
jgi:hypothetical protein